MATTPVSSGRYNAVAMTLHWVIAALILTNIGLAWYWDGLTPSSRFGLTQIHKSIGITVLALSLVRLAWRFLRPPPPLPSTLAPYEKLIASTVYVLFYLFMIGMPLSGWAMVSASKRKAFPTGVFGIPFPAIPPVANLPADQLHQAHELLVTTHELLAWAAYVLIALHVLAAFRHLLLLRDGVMARMVPFLKAKPA